MNILTPLEAGEDHALNIPAELQTSEISPFRETATTPPSPPRAPISSKIAALQDSVNVEFE